MGRFDFWLGNNYLQLFENNLILKILENKVNKIYETFLFRHNGFQFFMTLRFKDNEIDSIKVDMLVLSI